MQQQSDTHPVGGLLAGQAREDACRGARRLQQGPLLRQRLLLHPICQLPVHGCLVERTTPSGEAQMKRNEGKGGIRGWREERERVHCAAGCEAEANGRRVRPDKMGLR